MRYQELKNGTSANESTELATEFISPSLRKVAIVGHGALATRQAEAHKHWIENGIEVHCADIDSDRLDDCVEGSQRYVLPDEEGRFLAQGPFDYLFVNNIPEEHLATAMYYGTYAKRIVIQKPQDLNFPLIETFLESPGLRALLGKTAVHDHYRNKGVVPALFSQLPGLLARNGLFKRMMFFLTESKGVNDEYERAASLQCGMIQDLGVHTFDLVLETLLNVEQWQAGERDDQIQRRIGGTIEIEKVAKYRQQSSILGDIVETIAAIDIHVTDEIEYPAGAKNARRFQHGFDVLIALGKGVSIEQGYPFDLKSVVIEFERENFNCIVDLKSLAVVGISPQGVNRKHGGMSRPLMLLSPKPPEHATSGLGGPDYRQWQSMRLSRCVAKMANDAQASEIGQAMGAYPPGRPLGDLLRSMAGSGRIRPVWNNLPPLTNYRIEQPAESPFFD